MKMRMGLVMVGLATMGVLAVAAAVFLIKTGLDWGRAAPHAKE